MHVIRRIPRFVVTLAVLAAAALMVLIGGSNVGADSHEGGYPELLALFEEWRELESPPLRDGAPDYTAATTTQRHAELAGLQRRLHALDPSGWPIEQQVDWQIVRAEMNGLDFDIRVLEPWARDPAYYASVWEAQSDTPAHEGPTHHALGRALDSMTFRSRRRGGGQADSESWRTIPPLLAQARRNLVGNARELWEAGIGNIRDQARGTRRRWRSAVLWRARRRESSSGARSGPPARLRSSLVGVARGGGLRRRPSPSGYRQGELHLVSAQRPSGAAVVGGGGDAPEARTRPRPRLAAARRAAQPRACRGWWRSRARRSTSGAPTRPSTRYLAFSGARTTCSPVREYMDPALRARLGSLRSGGRAQLLPHRHPLRAADALDPLLPLVGSGVDGGRSASEPDPSRAAALQHLRQPGRGPGDRGRGDDDARRPLRRQRPRVREIVWIMLAQRAARGLGSLYVHANELDDEGSP